MGPLEPNINPRIKPLNLYLNPISTLALNPQTST